MSELIDGVECWSADDRNAGLCHPRVLWKPVVEGNGFGESDPPLGPLSPVAAPSEAPAPFSGGVPLFQPSNVASFRQAQIEEMWAAGAALRPAVLAGNRQAADSFVKIHDRLAKLLGTDAPKQSVTFTGGNVARMSDAELEYIARGGLTLAGVGERVLPDELIQGPDGTFAERPAAATD